VAVGFAYLGGHVGAAGHGVQACRRPFVSLPPQAASAGGGQLRSARKRTTAFCEQKDDRNPTFAQWEEDWLFNAEPPRLPASPRVPQRIWSLPHLAMAVALLAAACGSPSLSLAEVANPVQALGTTISKKIAPAIPKIIIDPVGFLDEPVQADGAVPGTPAAKAAAGGKPAASPPKVVPGVKAASDPKKEAPARQSAMSKVPSVLKANKSGYCPTGFVKSLISSGQISISCKPKTLEDARRAMLSNLDNAQRVLQEDEEVAENGRVRLVDDLQQENDARAVAGEAKAKANEALPVVAPDAKADPNKADALAEVERNRILAESNKVREAAAKKIAATQQREATAEGQRRKGKLDSSRKEEAKKRDDEAKSLDLRKQDKEKEAQLQQIDADLRKAQEVEIIKQLEMGGDIPLTDTLPRKFVEPSAPKNKKPSVASPKSGAERK